MRVFCSILLVFALAACTTLRVKDIPIAKDATFDLLSPAALGQSVSLEQIVDAKYGDKQFSFHCLLEVDPKQLTLVGMTPMNTRAFTLTFDGRELSVEMMSGAQLPAPPERILADLQLALWPDPKVHGLQRAECLGSDSPTGGRWWREFSRDGNPVVRVYYDKEYDPPLPRWGKLLIFVQHEQQYTLKVSTLRAETLES